MSSRPLGGRRGLPESTPASELALNDEVERITVPFNGNEYVCPNCEKSIPNGRLITTNRPPKYAANLNVILRCPFCWWYFSPRNEAFVLRH